jgi:short chain dehydrogenase
MDEGESVFAISNPSKVVFPGHYRVNRTTPSGVLWWAQAQSESTWENRQNIVGDHMSKVTEKVALVTGGSRGIGAAIAKRLAADGANVAITYTKGADAAASVVNEIERAGRKAIAIQGDATDADAVEAAVEKTVATFGSSTSL